MLRTYLKSKLHLGRVTEANTAYEGSVSIDQSLLEAADIAPYEQIHVWDVSNGERFITYAIPAHPGSGVICVNGAGARLVQPGDQVIIASFVQSTAHDAAGWTPRNLLLNERNAIVRSRP